MILEARIEAACCDLMSEVVRGAGEASVKVTGFSMLPAIWPGDVLRVRRLSADEVRAGQVVVYRRDGKLVAHRVICAPRGAGEAVITRGDSVPLADAPVETSELVGQVVGIGRRGRAVRVESWVGQRAAAWVLRRSEGWTRMAMRWSALERGLRRGD